SPTLASHATVPDCLPFRSVSGGLWGTANAATTSPRRARGLPRCRRGGPRDARGGQAGARGILAVQEAVLIVSSAAARDAGRGARYALGRWHSLRCPHETPTPGAPTWRSRRLRRSSA